ncbi:Type IV secretory system Conjugative DNA transfer [Mucilaginibacter gossypiicola]|uniref:Type IV secretory system Conjugative DNA transfer n=1 Tax=Mucilaginibacter gossypiicola TaxID=551995 RepID=A0A1H8DMI7_9SPHI|nr:conjugal transfer protein MobC [Mucilaginibacter gossypiicola]SEN08512.1 Type IV secretory system Conjugative DNA transfer [Mucilaginibacter gossypiicola]
MQTGENEQALRKITDFTRFLAVVILMLHFYFSCYAAFRELHLTHKVTDHILVNIFKLSFFGNGLLTKSVALLLLIVSLIGTKGKKDEKVKWAKNIIYAGIGLGIYFFSGILLHWKLALLTIAGLYLSLTSIGFLLFLAGVSKMFRIIRLKLTTDIFNAENETFPQEERKLENEYSINLPAQYNYKGKRRDSWINVINPFRGSLILGTPGAGKSYFVIRHIITQHIKKGFSMLIYDFKFDDLSIIAYNALLKYAGNYKKKPSIWFIDFDNIKHRCNPLDPDRMEDITDAMESSRTFMLGLNREWKKKQGDFFVESPINFVTALFWFLKKYENGKYCTLPHAIELAQVDYENLFALLQKEPEIEVLINPFISAWKNEAYDQLEGQIASAKISMARLVSPALYYVLSGNDFSLDLNNPEEPKIICLGNNPLKQQVYGAVLSLYISRGIKLVNQKNKLKSNLIFDEFPTIYFNNIDSLIATARSNKVATTLAVQDYSQLKKDYGREQAEVIMNIVGNIISGQVTGDTAKQLSERFGKIMQERQSVSINSQDTSISKSTQLDFAIPASKISTLSSGEFVGLVADNPDEKIDLKVFHNSIINDHDALKIEADNYKPIPAIRKIDNETLTANYFSIKADIEEIIRKEIPAKAG